MRYPAHHENQIQGTLAQNLVRDIHIATSAVVSFWNLQDLLRRTLHHRRLGPRDEAIPAPMSRFDETRLSARIVKRFPYFGDRDFQNVVADVDVRPDASNQLRFADELSGPFG